MGVNAENSSWSKGKAETLREYRKSTETVLSAVAGRGFSNLPGFALEAVTDAEMSSKLKLTELNQQIMAEALDRAIKRIGAQTDIALRHWTMLWGQQKAGLMADIQKEYADKNWLRTLSDMEIESAMIDQEVRGMAVVLARIALALEGEQLNRQFAEMNGETMPYEKALAYWKMQTTIAKESELPFIETALNEQVTAFDIEVSQIYPENVIKTGNDYAKAEYVNREILPVLNDKAALMETLAQELGRLVEPLRAKAMTSRELADVMMAQLDNHKALAEEKVILAREKVKRAEEEMLLTEKDITLDQKKIQIELIRSGMELQRAEAKLEIADALRVQLGNITTAMLAESDADINRLYTVGRNEVAVKAAKIEYVDRVRYEATRNEWESQINAIIAMALSDYTSRITIATKSADATLTEKLVHAFASSV